MTANAVSYKGDRPHLHLSGGKGEPNDQSTAGKATVCPLCEEDLHTHVDITTERTNPNLNLSGEEDEDHGDIMTKRTTQTVTFQAKKTRIMTI